MSDGLFQLGGFQLTTNPPRFVYLNFDMGIGGSGPNGGTPVVLPSGLYNVNLANAEGTCSDNLNYLKVAPGDTFECGMLVQFASGGQNYELHQNRTNYPGTNSVSITCTSAAGKPCSAWTVQPSAGTYNTAVLMLEQSGKHGITEVQQGQYLMSFLITITNP